MLEVLDELRMPLGDIFCFADVALEIVEGTGVQVQFPAAGADGQQVRVAGWAAGFGGILNGGIEVEEVFACARYTRAKRELDNARKRIARVYQLSLRRTLALQGI